MRRRLPQRSYGPGLGQLRHGRHMGQTDGRIAVSLNGPLRRRHNNSRQWKTIVKAETVHYARRRLHGKFYFTAVGIQ